MGALKIIGWIIVALIIIAGLNFIRTHEFIDVFTIVFVLICLLALTGFSIYISKEGDHG